MNQTKDIVALRKLAEEWHAGWIAGNAEALLALYADDPVLMPQNQAAVIGKEAIRALYASVFEQFSVKGRGQLVEIVVTGDWGYLWSTYILTATAKESGEVIEDNGKSVFIVRRQRNGSWKITRLITNSDRPPDRNP
jgi:uncharacterized protein (TIGR02246 family)